MTTGRPRRRCSPVAQRSIICRGKMSLLSRKRSPPYVPRMPRKSKADHLKVVSLGRPRPEPPSSLDAAEARSWRAIVDAAPSGFLDGAAQLILRQVVAQVA